VGLLREMRWRQTWKLAGPAGGGGLAPRRARRVAPPRPQLHCSVALPPAARGRRPPRPPLMRTRRAGQRPPGAGKAPPRGFERGPSRGLTAADRAARARRAGGRDARRSIAAGRRVWGGCGQPGHLLPRPARTRRPAPQSRVPGGGGRWGGAGPAAPDAKGGRPGGRVGWERPNQARPHPRPRSPVSTGPAPAPTPTPTPAPAPPPPPPGGGAPRGGARARAAPPRGGPFKPGGPPRHAPLRPGSAPKRPVSPATRPSFPSSPLLPARPRRPGSGTMAEERELDLSNVRAPRRSRQRLGPAPAGRSVGVPGRGAHPAASHAPRTRAVRCCDQVQGGGRDLQQWVGRQLGTRGPRAAAGSGGPAHWGAVGRPDRHRPAATRAAAPRALRAAPQRRSPPSSTRARTAPRPWTCAASATTSSPSERGGGGGGGGSGGGGLAAAVDWRPWGRARKGQNRARRGQTARARAARAAP
jgi:hypothetical protein